MMLSSALLIALAATTQAPPPVLVRAQAQASVRIVHAVEVRNGATNSPHQRTVRRDENGQRQILVQFE